MSIPHKTQEPGTELISVLMRLPAFTAKKASCSQLSLFAPANDQNIVPQIQENECYEPSIADWISFVVRPGDFCIDGGANFGQHSILMSKLVGPTGKVFSFEASQYTFLVLQKNLIQHGCQNVEALPVGLWSHETEIEFCHVENAPGWSFFSTSGYQEGVVTKIPCRSIDSYITQDMPRISLIKLDIEGSEIQAIQGARETIRRNGPVLILEMNKVTLKKFFNASEVQLFEEVQALNYEVHVIDNRAKLHLIPNLDMLAQFFETGIPLLNLLCIPAKKVG